MSLFQRLCPAPFSLVSKAFRGLRPRTRSELQKASLQAASSQEQVSAAEKPEQDPQTVSMETGEGSACSVSSLGCPRARLPTCYTWACAGGPALEAKNLPELRFAASAPRSVHTPHRLVGQSLCLCSTQPVSPLPRGGEVWGSNLSLSAGRCRRGLGQSLTSGSELTQARGAGTASQVPSIRPPR